MGVGRGELSQILLVEVHPPHLPHEVDTLYYVLYRKKLHFTFSKTERDPFKSVAEKEAVSDLWERQWPGLAHLCALLAFCMAHTQSSESRGTMD